MNADERFDLDREYTLTLRQIIRVAVSGAMAAQPERPSEAVLVDMVRRFMSPSMVRIAREIAESTGTRNDEWDYIERIAGVGR